MLVVLWCKCIGGSFPMHMLDNCMYTPFMYSFVNTTKTVVAISIDDALFDGSMLYQNRNSFQHFSLYKLQSKGLKFSKTSFPKNI